MDNLLILLKMDLQITVDAYDTFLKQLLDQAKEALEIVGITIDLNSINDCIIKHLLNEHTKKFQII